MENTAKTPGYRNLIESAMSDERELVRVKIEAGIATVTMDDPASYNALSATLCYQLRERIEETLRRPDVEVLILTGCDPAFSAGGDMRLMEFADTILKEGREGAIGMWRWIRYQFGGVARALTGSDKLCIAALNGPAAGVGLAFALACDIIVASERARLVTAFAKIGLLPEVGTNWLFSRRIGHHRFMELYLSGEERMSSVSSTKSCRMRRCWMKPAPLPPVRRRCLRGCSPWQNLSCAGRRICPGRRRSPWRNMPSPFASPRRLIKRRSAAS